MEVNNSTNEHVLLLQVSLGDERAFTALFNDYQPLLYRFVYRLTKTDTLTEEIVQDVFLKIWMSRESLSQVKSFKDYLFIVSRNHALNFIKKMAAEQKKEMLLKDSASEIYDQANERHHYGTIIDEAISRLPPQQQKVYLLSRHECLKYAAIATMMGIAPRTVKSYIRLAVESITAFIKDKGLLLLIAFIFGR